MSGKSPDTRKRRQGKMITNIKYTEGWDSPNFVGEVMSFTFTMPKQTKVEAIMSLICEASDSNQPIRMCWCPECRDERKVYGVRKARETKALAYPQS
jgi:hypothetical protein